MSFYSMSLPIFIDRPNDETESDCTKKQAYREAFPLQMWYFSQPIIHPSSSRSIKLQVQIKVLGGKNLMNTPLITSTVFFYKKG